MTSCYVGRPILARLLREVRFLEVQLQQVEDVFGRDTSPDLAARVARVLRRLNELEQQLRWYARELGENPDGPLPDLCDQLQQRLADEA